MRDLQGFRETPAAVRFDIREFGRRLTDALDLQPFEDDFDMAASTMPMQGGSVSSFAAAYLRKEAFSKYPLLNIGVDTKAAAYAEFQRCEAQCALTNERAARGRLGRHSRDLSSVFHIAQKKIARVLGPVPPLERLDLRFGPGASFECRGVDTSVYKKLQSPMQMTYGMRSFASSLRETLPHLLHGPFSLVHGSSLTFVPKNAKTDRPINIEPLLNGMVQKGIGSYLRSRLSRIAGVDLDDQYHNRHLANCALGRGLATVDLKSASDMISCGLVLDLLPIEWVDYLDTFRSHRYHYDGVWTEFHKFSAMGNAFTFELESLIFWGLGSAACEHLGVPHCVENFSVYGDDVVLPVEALGLFSEALTEAGLEVNEKKTYGRGSLFFESCGGDYYLGCDVTPFRVKKPIRTAVDVIWLANAVRRYAEKCAAYGPIFGRLHAVWYWLVSQIRPRDLLMGPAGYGDGHLHVDWDVAVPPVVRVKAKARYGWQGWYFRSWVSIPSLVSLPEWPMAYALYHAGNREVQASDGYSVRRHVTTKKKRILCFDWHSGSDR